MVAFYEEVRPAESLPRTLDEDQIECLAREMAEFHLACAAIAPALPPTSNSVKADAIHLLDQLESPFAPRNFNLPPEYIGVLHRHTHDFLLELERIRYDEWDRLPVLVDWNLGNFSVAGEPDGSFRLFSRWDYDWFRIEPRLHDFYFLSRVSSATGDRTQFTYSSHTLVEPRFVRFVEAYHAVNPLEEREVRFLPEAYRFFLLNYVIREGARFFRPDYCERFRRETARVYLPALERLDISPLLRAIEPDPVTASVPDDGRIDVCVVGSANLDLVARVERLPGPGETVLGSAYADHPGGKGLNQAVAAARAGAQTAFVGAVGRRPRGRAPARRGPR